MRFNKLLLGSALVVPMMMTSCGGDTTLIKNPRIDVTNGVCYNYSKSECTIKLNDSRLKWDEQANLTRDKFGFPSEIDSKTVTITRIDDSQIKFTFSGAVTTDFSKDDTYTVSVDPSIIKGITVEDAKFEISLMRTYFQITTKYDFSNDQYAFDGYFKGFEVNKFFSFTEYELTDFTESGGSFEEGNIRISQSESNGELRFYIYGYNDPGAAPLVTLDYDHLKFILNDMPKNAVIKLNFACDEGGEEPHLYFPEWQNTFLFKLEE